MKKIAIGGGLNTKLTPKQIQKVKASDPTGGIVKYRDMGSPEDKYGIILGSGGFLGRGLQIMVYLEDGSTVIIDIEKSQVIKYLNSKKVRTILQRFL
jgi:hypothetical protein